ncbi:MAG: hypothetical protein KIT09_05220 [Bryobacteraceae bacterium]|nr:hypothetical protein [Bryobacteraceae bacterium]
MKGISPYSAGGVASPGFEIEHARLQRPLPLDAGFDLVSDHLQGIGRPRQALCGMELRSPRPFTFEGFGRFNAGYVETLKRWDVFVDGVNPVARTNVAPEVAPPAEPSLYGFSYTVPSGQAAKRRPPSFIVAGAGELPEGSLDARDVVRRGETSADAIEAKARFVLDLMEGRLRELGASWADVTVAELYTVHDVHPFLQRMLLPRMGGAPHGLTWHFARPPIVSIEFEMDLRGCRRELVLRS